MTVYDRLLIYLNKHSFRGKDRFYAFLQRFGFKKLLTVNCAFNIRMNLNPYEYIDGIAIKEGFYESEVTDAILLNLGNNGTFWDIGANIGLHSIAVKKNRPGVNVVSFEPNPKTLGLLYENAKLNELNIDICEFALFDQMQITTLYIAEGNSGMTTITPWNKLDYKSTVKCQTLTGNYLVKNGFEIPNILKIDTEGSELQVINGCSDFLGKPEVKAVIFEGHMDLANDDSANEIVTTLKGHGFNIITELKRKENTHHALSNYILLKS
ncbi:FkbM family methyltransferase [Mucilaginibacter celer]|uniref:FkbM family methyltransferase n=1 Tax=Mucilaginibacter celer TaxID=2305508 RepID=A0A494VRM0_9SPHI|nr:FkbM family methyltransferase [Mucilaginibacter celer]AYL98256.1 FkbM family methyltransferase [Mucilaginibacter celer]